MRSPGWAWNGAGSPSSSYILYELHVGTYTPEGTFDAVIPRLDSLVELGVTAVELMPVSQFPGRRNWGYDGVFPFAVQDCYGGPEGLKRLVDACHLRGLAVVLGRRLQPSRAGGELPLRLRPLLHRPVPHSVGIRRELRRPRKRRGPPVLPGERPLLDREFHVDALRLDAVHAIMDVQRLPFLSELAGAVQRPPEEEAGWST